MENIRNFLKRYSKTKVFQKAQAIDRANDVSMTELDEKEFDAAFEVYDITNAERYEVDIEGYDSPNIETFCDCDYDGYVCEHSLASLIFLWEHITGEVFDIEMLSKGRIGRKPTLKRSPAAPSKTINITPPVQSSKSNKTGITEFKNYPELTLRDIEKRFPNSFGHVDFFQMIMLGPRIRVVSQTQGKMVAHIMPESKWKKGPEQVIEITINSQNDVTIKCSCKHDESKLCLHKATLLKGLGQSVSDGDLLLAIRPKEHLITPLLKEYGLTLQDDWQKHFDTAVNGGKIYLVAKTPGLAKAASFADWKNESNRFFTAKPTIPNERFKPLNTKQNAVAVLWHSAGTINYLPFFDLLTGKTKKDGTIGAPLKVFEDSYRTVKLISPLDHQLYNRFIKMEAEQLKTAHHLPPFDNHDFDSVIEYFKASHYELSNVFPEFANYQNLLADERAIDAHKYHSLPVSETHQIFPQVGTSPSLSFEFRKSPQHYLLKPFLHIGETRLNIEDVLPIAFGLVHLKDFKAYLLPLTVARALIFFQDKPDYRIRHVDLVPFVQDFLLPLMEQFPVKMFGVKLEIIKVEPQLEKILYLKEVEEHLLLVPAFRYTIKPDEETEVVLENPEKDLGTTDTEVQAAQEEKEDFLREVEMDGGESLSWSGESGEVIYQMPRLKEEEAEFFQFLQERHPEFEFQYEHFFSLPIEKVFQHNWFFDLFAELEEQKVQVLGLKELKKVNYNPYRPSIRLTGSSGIDWFGVKMEVSFGDQKAKIADIRKAVMNNQHYVKLGDGSMGVLPKEWLEKYSSMLKVGKVKGNNIELSQFQVPLVEQFYQEIDNNEAIGELIAKKNRLMQFRQIQPKELPSNIKAELRNYQKEGYNWLQFLEEYGWGGCLADDMGLGKTIQVLTFLQDIINQHPKSTHLIVVPRSLVFNWQAEVKKFCPDLNILDNSGAARTKKSADFKKYHLVITTYALVRKDIEILKDFPFHYVVLDESQAIKNPEAQMSKAVKLLKAKNRLIMTGTPIENNTFDLYSQMDFLNPGMLGALDTFRHEFANKIDKDRDEETAKHLRSIVYPLILSRKKKEVAKELPDKTETVLYCEMGAKQRKVYDFFKDKFRKEITEAIEKEGMNKAGMYILQGLLKLRQICNSPQLLPEQDGEFTHDSAKMETLLSNMEEVLASGQKILVFSYFVGMLDLIKAELEKRNIGSSWLSGSSHDREAIVKDFKNNPEKKVFLISLKAGGFGLNLTEASYVYLVDPWWNPAVEQQAIDRTHRIGQTNQVFAYKLICKDSIEEKILELQEKKKAVAADIVNVESGFLKKLDKSDVEALFR